MPIEHVRVSQQAKDHLIRLKRLTGIKNWNVLCRWALCLSLAEESEPSGTVAHPESNVEMTWRVFGGRYADLYLAMLKERCLKDGLGTDEVTIAQQLRLHLHRGIAYLVSNKGLRGVADFVLLVNPEYRNLAP